MVEGFRLNDTKTDASTETFEPLWSEGGQGPTPSGPEEKPIPGTWEFKFAAQSPSAYATARTVADFVPFMWTVFPSARKHFSEKGTGEQVLDIGLDTAFLALAGGGGKIVGKGARSILAGVGGKFKKPGKGLVSLSAAEESIPFGSRYEAVPLVEKIKTKWKLGDEEANVVMSGQAKPRRVQMLQDDGSFRFEKPTAGLKKLYGKKNRLSQEAQKELDYWKLTPEPKQRADFYRKRWAHKIKTMTGSEPNTEALFQIQMEKLVGTKHAHKFKLENASSKVMANIFSMAMGETKFMMGTLDIGYNWLVPTVLLPLRKAFGSGERVFGTYGIYGKIKNLYKKGNDYTFQQAYNYMIKMEAAGLGTILKRPLGKGGKSLMSGFKPVKELTQKVLTNYKKAAIEIDNMTAAGANESAIAAFLNQQDDIVRKLVLDVHFPFLDDLYKDYTLHKLPQLFASASLSQEGKFAITQHMYGAGKGWANEINKIFSSVLDESVAGKNKRMHDLLMDIKETLAPNGHWFEQKAEVDLKTRLGNLFEGLTPSTRKKVGFPNYLENYTMRMKQNNALASAKKASALGTKHATWLHSRKTMTGFDPGISITRMLESRISAQSRELFVGPGLSEELKKISKLPEGYKKHFDHWLARMNGEPTQVDDAIAQWLTKTSPAFLSKMFPGRSEVWTAERLRDLSYRINDFTYLGGLGFKPYSAVRNIFQPFVTVPTDLGGVKDIYWLLRGFKRASDPKSRELIRSWGAIAEYTEEIAMRSPMLKLGPQIMGKQMPALSEIRDVGMWMFKKSDQWNRYVTGGAVLEKWAHTAGKHLTVGKNWNPQLFMKKMRFNGRDDWIRRDLEGIMAKLPKKPTPDDTPAIQAYLEQARAKFTTDVIADTQWLYGAMDAPIINSRFGVISKTGVIFQSWWMNYATALEKWFFRTGDLPQKLERFGTWVISSAIAGELMVHGAGFKDYQAAKTVGFGPLPNQAFLPPTWAPLYHAIGTVGNLAVLEPEMAKARFKRLTRSLEIGVPGGIQAGKMIRGAADDGGEGFVRGGLNYFGGTGEKFIIGR